MSDPNAPFFAALTERGIDHDSHHMTLKSAVKELTGHQPSAEELVVLRAALKAWQSIESAMPPLPSGAPIGRVNPNKLSRPKVGIVGFTGHRHEAFGRGDDWEIWGINELHRHHDIRLFHRWFEIHEREDFENRGEGHPGDPDHLKSLGTFDVPVYMHQHWDDIPTSVPFPRDEIIAWHNERGNRGDYQTSSISWEVAHALMLGAEEIGIFGVDMANNTEYAEQRPCLEYWIGVASRMTGKPVVLPETCDLMTAFGQYGFKDQGNKLRTMMEARLAWLHQMHNHHLTALRKLESDKAAADVLYTRQHEQHIAHCAEWLGAINDCGYMIRSWMGTKHELTGNPTPDRSKDPMTAMGPPTE